MNANANYSSSTELGDSWNILDANTVIVVSGVRHKNALEIVAAFAAESITVTMVQSGASSSPLRFE